MEDNKMEETVSKVTYAKNLNKQNFSASISIPIDTNVNIKTILQIDSYLFDEKVECGNGLRRGCCLHCNRQNWR